jgi:hypothetical protein
VITLFLSGGGPHNGLLASTSFLGGVVRAVVSTSFLGGVVRTVGAKD